MQDAYGGFRADDLYPDALPALVALRRAGFGVAVIGNQPAAPARSSRALQRDHERTAHVEVTSLAVLPAVLRAW